MKLKLETHDEVTVLVVTEDVSREHLPVLKAGLSKLMKSGKKVFVLNILGVTNAPPETGSDLNELIKAFAEDDVRLAVASKILSLNALATQEEAITHVRSPLVALLTLESSLKKRIVRVTSEKALIQKEADAAATRESQIRNIRAENSRMKLIIQSLEALIVREMDSRKAPAPPAQQARQQSLEKTTTAVLEQEGVLPVV